MDSDRPQNSVDMQVACIFLTHQDFVKGLAIHYAPWPGIVDDIVQQVFLEFVTKKEGWDTSSDIKPLLSVITRNIAKRFWREKMRAMPQFLQKIADRLEQSNQTEEPERQYEEKRLALNECMDKLPTKQRALVEFRYFGAMSPDKIAEHFQISKSVVNQTLYRIREKLQGCIERKMQRGRHET